MTWVKKVSTQHYCKLPGVSGYSVTLPDDVGFGSLWRCDKCLTLWQVKFRCSRCNASKGKAHDGYHSPGYAWDRATFWTRMKHRNEGVEFV